jgi:hypothetical protein
MASSLPKLTLATSTTSTDKDCLNVRALLCQGLKLIMITPF